MAPLVGTSIGAGRQVHYTSSHIIWEIVVSRRRSPVKLLQPPQIDQDVSVMLKLPPPIWCLVFAVTAGVISVAAPWRAIIDLRLVPLGVALVALGFVLPVWAFTLFQREGTEVNPTSEANKKLVTFGPYAITRNPMYLGLVVISLGLAFWVGSLPMFAVPLLAFAVANWVHIPFEEAKMRRQFGAQFDDYTRKVRRWI